MPCERKEGVKAGKYPVAAYQRKHSHSRTTDVRLMCSTGIKRSLSRVRIAQHCVTQLKVGRSLWLDLRVSFISRELHNGVVLSSLMRASSASPTNHTTTQTEQPFSTSSSVSASGSAGPSQLPPGLGLGPSPVVVFIGAMTLWAAIKKSRSIQAMTAATR